MPDTLVLDSLALISFFLGQTAAPRMAEILTEADRNEVALAITTVNLGEMLYRVERESDHSTAAQALQIVRLSHVEIHDTDDALAVAPARVKVDLKMGYLDCFVVALAQRLQAKVLTGDPDFRRAEGTIDVVWLER